MKTRLLSLACVTAMALGAVTAHAEDAYILGHEDDWQLFMGERAFDDIALGNRVIFIYVTAGDSGYGTGGWGSVPMYIAREEGAIASASIATSVIERWFPNDKSSWQVFRGHQIRKVVHRNTVHYFMRLPNGAPDGKGYVGTGYQSLARLRAGLIPTITAVDNSSAYSSYTDVKLTLEAILNQFEPGIINLTDVDWQLNPGSHSDHQETGILTINAFNYGAKGYRFWKDYSVVDVPTSLDTAALIKKAEMVGGMAHAMTVRGYNGVYHPWHNQFLPKSSFREVPAPYFGLMGKK